MNGKKSLGDKEFSTAIVKILEKNCNEKLFAKGFPNKLVDNMPRREGIEIKF